MQEIQGIIVPILTPMNADESVNEAELRRQIDRLIGAGVSGIFPFGTNGEGYILSEQEKEQVLAVCVEQTAGRTRIRGYRLHLYQGYHPPVPAGQGTGGGRAVHHYPLLCRRLPGGTV